MRNCVCTKWHCAIHSHNNNNQHKNALCLLIFMHLLILEPIKVRKYFRHWQKIVSFFWLNSFVRLNSFQKSLSVRPISALSGANDMKGFFFLFSYARAQKSPLLVHHRQEVQAAKEPCHAIDCGFPRRIFGMASVKQAQEEEEATLTHTHMCLKYRLQHCPY